MYRPRRDNFQNPERFLNELIVRFSQGRFVERDENPPVLHRATVLAVDVVGGKLENPDGSGEISHSLNGQDVTVKARIGPENPRNSIKARIISDGFDQFSEDELVRVFWPLLPEHLAVPVKPGEHVYVLFEDRLFQHGMWIGKVPGHVGTNISVGQSNILPGPPGGNISSKFGARSVSLTERQDTDEFVSERRASKNNLSKKFR